jgi:hypothetical protein
MIKVGQKVRFNPYHGVKQSGLGVETDITEGVVHYVHPTNRWFNIKYNGGDGPLLTGFKFDDIGKVVKIIY